MPYESTPITLSLATEDSSHAPSNSTSKAASSSTPLVTSSSPSKLLSTPSSVLPQEQQHTQALRHVITSVFLFGTASSIVVTIRPQLILDATNNDASKSSIFNGVVMSLGSVLSVFSIPLCGAVSDAVGRKPIFLLSHSGELLNLILLSCFPLSLLSQFFANLLLVSSSIYWSLAYTVVADIAAHSTTPAATHYGYLGGTLGSCYLFAPALGGYLEETVHRLSSLLVSAVFVIMAFLYAAIFLPETLDSPLTEYGNNNQQQQSLKSSLKKAFHAFTTTDINPIPRARSLISQSPAMKYLAFMYAADTISLAGLNSILYLYIAFRLGWGPQQFGLLSSAIGVVVLGSQIALTPMMISTFGEKVSILAGIVSLIITYFMYAFVTSSYQMYIILAVSVLGFVVDPAVKGILARQAPPHLQGGLQGSFAAVGDVVKPFSPIVVNLLLGIGISIGMSGLPIFVLGIIKVASLCFAWLALSSPGLQ